MFCYRDRVDDAGVVTLKQKIEAERALKQLLKQNGMPEPDAVEYGYQCIRFFWYDTKTVVVVDLDPESEDEWESEPPVLEDGESDPAALLAQWDDDPEIEDNDDWGLGAEYMGLGEGLFGEKKLREEGRGLPPEFN